MPFIKSFVFKKKLFYLLKPCTEKDDNENMKNVQNILILKNKQHHP